MLRKKKLLRGVYYEGYVLYGFAGLFILDAGVNLRKSKDKNITLKATKEGAGLCFSF